MYTRLYLRQSKGFTLLELIVVIAILGILSAIMVPSIVIYTEKAKLTSNLSEVKNVYRSCNTIITELRIDDPYCIINNKILIRALSDNFGLKIGNECPRMGTKINMIYVNYIEEVELRVSYFEGTILKITCLNGEIIIE